MRQHPRIELPTFKVGFCLIYLPLFCAGLVYFFKLKRSYARKTVFYNLNFCIKKDFTSIVAHFYISAVIRVVIFFVNIIISARGEGISSIKCRLRYVLEQPFRILVYLLQTT